MPATWTKKHSIISNLGFIPPDLDIKSVEVSRPEHRRALQQYGQLKGYGMLQSSVPPTGYAGGDTHGVGRKAYAEYWHSCNCGHRNWFAARCIHAMGCGLQYLEAKEPSLLPGRSGVMRIFHCMYDIANNSFEADASLIEILVEEDIAGNMLRVKIKDNGRGMDEETVRKAVDPFYTSGKRGGWDWVFHFLRRPARCGVLSIKSKPGRAPRFMPASVRQH